MSRSLTWRHLSPGVAIIVVGAVGVAAVFKYARVGALRGDTVRFHALTDNVAGLAQGAEVMLSGHRVGRVRAIGFRSAASDSSLRIVITAEIKDEYQPYVRRDSYAAIRPAGSLVGAPALMITPGTRRTPAVRAGDTLSTRAQADFEALTSRAAVASRDFPAIIANVKLLASQLAGTNSTVGAIVTSDAGAAQMSELTRRSGRLVSQLSGGGGTVGRALQGDAAARARRAAANLDTLRALLGSESPALGPFRRDSTLLQSVEQLRNEVSIVRALLAEPRGTAGRALTDQAIQREIRGAESELTALVADIKARPLRYVTF